MRREHEHKYLTYSLRIYVRFLGQFFFLSFPRERWEKKDHCVMFGCNNYDHLFPEKYTVKFSFCPKPRINTERVPLGDTIILFKSNLWPPYW